MRPIYGNAREEVAGIVAIDMLTEGAQGEVDGRVEDATAEEVKKCETKLWNLGTVKNFPLFSF